MVGCSVASSRHSAACGMRGGLHVLGGSRRRALGCLQVRIFLNDFESPTPVGAAAHHLPLLSHHLKLTRGTLVFTRVHRGVVLFNMEVRWCYAPAHLLHAGRLYCMPLPPGGLLCPTPITCTHPSQSLKDTQQHCTPAPSAQRCPAPAPSAPPGHPQTVAACRSVQPAAAARPRAQCPAAAGHESCQQPAFQISIQIRILV